MNRVVCLVALAFAVSVVSPAPYASAARVTKRVKSASAPDLIVACDAGPITVDYKAQTASGVSLSDPYAVARDADKGLVFLMNAGGRRAKSYSVPHQTIRAIVSMRYDETVLDRLDFVFTARRLDVIHTTSTNAGVFVVSNVYELPYAGGGANATLPAGDPDASKLLKLGLQSYSLGTGECAP